MTQAISGSADAFHWQDILDKLNAGEMPPVNERQPSKEEISDMLEYEK